MAEKNNIAAVKQGLAKLSNEILAKEQETLRLIKREVSMENHALSLLGKMVSLEKQKVFETEKKSSEKEKRLKARIESLKKKKVAHEKKKETLNFLKQKKSQLQKELESLTDNLASQAKELYGIQNVKTHAGKKIKKDLKNLRAKAKKLAKAVSKEKKKEEKIKIPVRKEKIADVKKEIQEALAKEKHREKKERAKKEFEWPKIEKGFEKTKEEKKEEPEEIGIIHITEGKETPTKEIMLEEEKPEPKEETKQEITPEPEETPETMPVEKKPKQKAKGVLEYSDSEIAFLYPDWPENAEKPKNAIISVAKGDFSCEIAKENAENTSLSGFVENQTKELQNRADTKIIMRKETEGNIFLEYSEDKNGKVFTTKVLFMLHKNNFYKTTFSAPEGEFSKIDDIFLKTLFSIKTA